MPPLQGSASTRSASPAVRARAVANTDAPAPPLAPTTATLGPHAPASGAAASDSTAINSASCVGSTITCCAPNATATCQSCGVGAAVPTRATRARRGTARSTHRCAAAVSRTTAAAADHAFAPDSSPTLTSRTPAAAATRATSAKSGSSATSARTVPGDRVSVGAGMHSPCGGGATHAMGVSQIVDEGRSGDNSSAAKALRRPRKMRRPPPGGEEAEVVVYQPRGVGLMHLGISRVMLTIHTELPEYARERRAPARRVRTTRRHLC